MTPNALHVRQESGNERAEALLRLDPDQPVESAREGRCLTHNRRPDSGQGGDAVNGRGAP